MKEPIRDLTRNVFGPRSVIEKGCAMIRAAEGLRLKAYACSAGICTIGWGHTRTARLGMTITEEEAERLFQDDVARAARDVEDLVTVPLTDGQFAALASFVFNVGRMNFAQSTLLRLLNRGWYEQVPAQLMRWTKVKGETLGGLVRRRAAEAQLWNAS